MKYIRKIIYISLALLSILISFIKIINIFPVKLAYYTSDPSFHSISIPERNCFLFFSAIAIIFTFLPMLILCIENIIIIILDKKCKIILFIFLMLTLGLAGINIFIEIVMFLGWVVGSNDMMIEISRHMLSYHFSTLIPFLLTFIAFITKLLYVKNK